MLNPDTRPSSIEGIKRLATQIKKTVGIPHHEALDLASRAASFQSFPLAHKALVRRAIHASSSSSHSTGPIARPIGAAVKR